MKNTSVYFYSTQWSPCSSWSSRTEHIRSHKNARRRHEHVTLRTKSYSLNLWIAKSWNNIIKKSISCLNNQICWNQLFLASINFIYVCPFSATLSMARMMDSYQIVEKVYVLAGPNVSIVKAVICVWIFIVYFT